MVWGRESNPGPVSYTHLDVYKRQPLIIPGTQLHGLSRSGTENELLGNRTRKLYKLVAELQIYWSTKPNQWNNLNNYKKNSGH